jgi:hypothetical protein
MTTLTTTTITTTTKAISSQEPIWSKTGINIKIQIIFFSLLKSWVTKNFITIKTSWNTND